MSDQNKYVNTFIENSVGMIHEYVSLVLQLKTQVKLSEDMLAEKNAIISSLDEQVKQAKDELESNKKELSNVITNSNERVSQSVANSSKWEQEYNSMKARVEHLDTFVNQVNEMKQMLIDKNKEIEDLQNKIETLSKKTTKNSTSKTVINTSNRQDVSSETKEQEPVSFMIESQPDKNDDF